MSFHKKVKKAKKHYQKSLKEAIAAPAYETCARIEVSEKDVLYITTNHKTKMVNIEDESSFAGNPTYALTPHKARALGQALMDFANRI